MTDTTRVPDWLSLDNAAKIYPPAYSDLAPEVFRVGVTLDRPVRLSALQNALDRTVHRCPYYQVNLRRGLFWYYLQRHDTPPRVELLGNEPVSRIRMRDRHAHLFRVFTRDRSIRVDFSHVLTDGFGALTFLSTLVAEYLRQRGVSVPSGGIVLDPNDAPSSAECSDAYQEMYAPGTPKPAPLGPAYHVPGRPEPGYHRIITGRIPAEHAVERARTFGVTLTEFLAGAYIHSIYRIWRRERHAPRKRPVVRLEVPADMRRVHPSRTMRNFSLFVAPEIDLRLGEYTLEETIRTVHHSMRLQLDPKVLRRQISRNVGGEHLFIIRVIPLLLKDWYLSSLHHRLGGNISSGVISNLGSVTFPVPMREHVTDVVFVLGPNPTLLKAISVVGYAGHLNITIGSVIESREVERLFFTTLTDQGLPVHISEQHS